MFFKNDEISSNSKVERKKEILKIKIYVFSMLGVLAIIYVVIIVPVEYFAKEHPDVHTKTQ